MEICILVKYILNKCIFLLCIIIFASCQTNSGYDYTKPDYTDIEILENEIEHINTIGNDNQIEALWLSYLLYEETNSDKALDLYNSRINSLFQYRADSILQEQWGDVVQISQSLLTLGNFLPEALTIDFDEDFLESYNNAIKAYESLANLKTPVNTQGNLSNVSTFITGVVTVWVDLGVRVERGLGYPNRSLGSGFFIDERGYIVTNHHVISELVDPEYEGYSRLYIKLSNDSETRIPAKVVGWDKTLDLALLKTEVTPSYVYTLGSSQNLTVGNPIYAIGSPVGLENTITSGIISAFDRQLLATAAVMQIDAAVNSGNSGGPLINTNGEVQGIVFAGLPTYQGLNFAIPVEYLKAILLRLYSEGEVTHSWMGAYGRTIKEYPSDEEGRGVEVLYVMPGSPAFHAGLEVGSIITGINGIKITSIESLQFALIHAIPESIVSIEHVESIGGEPSFLPVYLDVRPENPGLAIYEREPSYKMVYPMFGMELTPSSVGNKNQFTVQSIIKGSIADESGFSVHDPVEIRKTVLTEEKDAVFIETFTKKRKSGYFEVNVSVGAALDSPFIF